ncbi:hypothetical protein C5167_037128 [Papaver somniferum]|uniref:TraB family protein n=1 Tax=Papaver somniferum TaxID=3469 RepID=A0A4Y7I5H6_PAPSO|nr:traB domain-containing protein-like [Papaver somniferum]XP_026430971.1 traB domain-containing protein-like [Papaver somniferum]RZC44183.1 hypothetical protein C5167_037128 [Papaver somniferum]
MSSTYNKLLRVFKKKSRKSHEQPSSSSSAQDEIHYQHGIPGIPTDGKVVLLNNSSNGAQIYLIGTVHGSKQSAETVKNVIDYVRPDVVAAELCEKRVMAMNKQPDNDTWYKLFRKSMVTPGGLCMKIYIFLVNCRRRRMHGYGITPGLEFKVAIEESSRVGASCFYIDQDIKVTHQQLSKVPSFDLLWKAYCDSKIRVLTDFAYGQYTRSFVREIGGNQKKRCPDIFKVIIEDRDKFMSIHLRSFQGKVVAVVGMAHKDGIELLWKLAEEDDN